MLYYFDSLPLHPPPLPLESLTSYLIRLAMINGLASVDSLSAVCFPNQDRRIPRGLADFPPLSLETLSAVTVCPVSKLRTTTFHHLAAKFGRSSHPQPISRFLAGSLASSLRYCPFCLRERAYYPLLWRFTWLPGCINHACHLLDRCTRCDQPIPLFSAPFMLGVCPTCRADLRECHAEPVNEQAWQTLVVRFDELVYLLSPQPWELHASQIIQALGQFFSDRRRRRQMNALEVAGQISVTLSRVEGIERGNTMTRGAILNDYFKYTDLLGLSLREALIETTKRATPAEEIGYEGRAVDEPHKLVKMEKKVIKLAKGDKLY